MNRFYYDLHIHSCLSPCGDEDSTPNNIAGMAALSELNIVALTDHNSCKNCPAFFAAAENYGITAIAGMELTTTEDIHVVCLFESLSDALRFDSHVEKNRMLIKNRPEFFGEQLILDKDDNITGEELNLLTSATYFSVDDIMDTVSVFNGVCYPAHIDRESNGIISVLGAIPPDSPFLFYEMHNGEKREEFSRRYGIAEKNIIVSSDAHNLPDIRDKENCFILDAEYGDHDTVRKKLFELLRGGKNEGTIA